MTEAQISLSVAAFFGGVLVGGALALSLRAMGRGRRASHDEKRPVMAERDLIQIEREVEAHALHLSPVHVPRKSAWEWAREKYGEERHG